MKKETVKRLTDTMINWSLTISCTTPKGKLIVLSFSKVVLKVEIWKEQLKC